LREYYPAALVAFDDLASNDCLAVLAKAPTPATGARLSVGQITAALKRGGRQRNLDRRATEIHDALCSEQLTSPEPITDAFAATTSAAVGIIGELNRRIAKLEQSLADHFEQHPDADIYRSLPGLGVILGAWALGEFGDDPNRYANPKSRQNYAGTSPLTVASGKKRAVVARHIRNRRLYDAIDQWAFCAIPTAQAAGLGNRLVGILHGCPTNAQALRRTHRLGTPNMHTRRNRRLTGHAPGVSNPSRTRLTRGAQATPVRIWPDRVFRPCQPSSRACSDSSGWLATSSGG
jgi:hypothetical protein